MSAGEGPPPEPSPDDDPDGPLRRFLTAESGPLMFAREMLTSVATVALVGLLLFGISGVWPPMVAVESGSMDPNMQKGDLIFVTEPGRFAPDAARGDTGVVTHRVGEEVGYETFNDYGTVVIYENQGGAGPPIIHRARFWVEKGENWYGEANKAWVEGADSCAEMDNCPAPHAGFITKGDSNGYYDQTGNIRSPVKPEWVIGTARLRIPYLGWVRLGFSGAAASGSGVTEVAAVDAPIEMTPAPSSPDVANATVPDRPTARGLAALGASGSPPLQAA